MLPTEVVECPCLEIFKIDLDIPLGNQLCEVLLEQDKLGQVTSRGPFWAQLLCSCVSHNIISFESCELFSVFEFKILFGLSYLSLMNNKEYLTRWFHCHLKEKAFRPVQLSSSKHSYSVPDDTKLSDKIIKITIHIRHDPPYKPSRTTLVSKSHQNK